MFSAVPAIAGLGGAAELVMWLERCYSRSSENDSNPEQMQRKLLRSPFTSAISSTVSHLEDRNLLGIRADNRRRQQTRVSNLAAMQQHLAKSQVKDGIEIFAFEW